MINEKLPLCILGKKDAQRELFYFGFATLLGQAEPPKDRKLTFGKPRRAALTAHRAVIHYRSPSSPCFISAPKKEEYRLVLLFFWCG